MIEYNVIHVNSCFFFKEQDIGDKTVKLALRASWKLQFEGQKTLEVNSLGVSNLHIGHEYKLYMIESGNGKLYGWGGGEAAGGFGWFQETIQMEENAWIEITILLTKVYKYF